MFRKIISLVTLVALLANTAGLTGCTANMMNPAFLTKPTAATVEGIKNPKFLRANPVIVYTKREVIEFDRNYARYDSTTNTVAGYSVSHGSVEIPFPDIIDVEIRGARKSIKSDVVPIEEVKIPPKKSLQRILLKDGYPVEFRGDGAQYIGQAGLIQGVSVSGSPASFRIGDVDSVYYVSEGDSAQHVQSGRNFENEQKTANKDTIKGKITAIQTGDRFVRFNQSYGRIDSLSHTVFGVTVLNDSVFVLIDSILTLHVERVNQSYRLKMVIGAVALVGLIYLITKIDFSGPTVDLSGLEL